MGGRCENATLLVRSIRINYSSYSILPPIPVGICRIYCEGYNKIRVLINLCLHLVCATLKRIQPPTLNMVIIVACYFSHNVKHWSRLVYGYATCFTLFTQGNNSYQLKMGL